MSTADRTTEPEHLLADTRPVTVSGASNHTQVGTLDSRPPVMPRGLVFGGRLITSLTTHAILQLLQAWACVTSWVFDSKKAAYGLSVTRMLMGATAFGLLLTNWSTRLYAFGAGSAWNGEMEQPLSDFPNIWLFSLFHRVAANNMLYTLCYIALIVLAVLIIAGWRFRVVAPIFWVAWVSFIEANDMLGDQGDNMFRIAFLLLMFTDAAGRWSFDARRRARKAYFRDGGVPSQISTIFHNLAIVALAAQVIFVYSSGALFKAAGEPWREGWAVYDPLATMRFGVWRELTDVLTAWGPMVAAFTLGSVFIQALFGIMLLHRATRIIALFAILSFHIGIAVLMGLPWFSLTMVAVDSIFIRDVTWQRMRDGICKLWRTS